MDQTKVGKFIAALRRERGLTQEALGQRLGVTNKTVSRWENGNYMPDIELLVPLGEELGVSVNELLAGKRLDDAAFRTQADENLVEAVRESAFTVKERTEFFKKKWRKERFWFIVLYSALCGALSLYLWLNGWLALLAVLWLVAYCYLNNRMMAYVEGRVYGSPKPPSGS